MGKMLRTLLLLKVHIESTQILDLIEKQYEFQKTKAWPAMHPVHKHGQQCTCCIGMNREIKPAVCRKKYMKQSKKQRNCWTIKEMYK